MLKISLMTLNMFVMPYFKYRLDKDLEDLEESYEEIMQLAYNSGYQAVDVTAFEVGLLSLDKVKMYLEKYNLKVSSYIHFDQFAAMDEDGFEARIAKGKQAADIAKMLDAKVLMLVPQAQENIAEYAPEEIRCQLARHWAPIAAYAKENGIHAVAEDTPDLKLQFCRTEELKEVLDQTPNLEVVYDSGNMLLVGEDPVTYYDTFADKTAHIHLKDMCFAEADEPFADQAADGKKMKAAPTGTGLVDFKTLIEHVQESQYEGYLTVEFAVDAKMGFYESLVRSREYVEWLLS